MNGRLLVVGAGQSGVQLAASAREIGWSGPITLVGSEPRQPYARPPLSKGVLGGTASIESLSLRSGEFYADADIELVTGEHVESLELTGGGAGRARASSGRRWDYDRLALSTGAAPRRLPIEGGELDGVVVLRDLDDAESLARRLKQVEDLVVVGGGFVGLEVAATAAAAGVRTTVVEAAAHLMNRVVSQATAAVVETAHHAAGVQVLTGTRPRRFSGENGAVTEVELADGERVPAGLVLVGVGAMPRDELARTAGLHCDGGIVVDGRALASDGYTVAAGDCTVQPAPSTLDPAAHLRLESVDNAVEQARIAAATLVGAPASDRGLPWFWSDQGPLKIQIVGVAAQDDQVVIRPGRKEGQHIALRYRGPELIAAECVNAPADFLAIRKALAEGIALPPAVAADTGRGLREYFRAARTESS